jgi:hypothetical protein
MKKIIPTLIKAILFALLVQNIGGWNFFQEAIKSSAKNTPTPEQLQKIENFTTEKIKLAEKKISQNLIYSPVDYFQDLLEIDKYSKSLGLNGQWFNQNVNNLQRFVQEQEAANKFSNRQISQAVEKYRGKLEDIRTDNHKIDFQELLNLFPMLWRFYLRNIFLGAALLLVWFYQGKKSLIIKNPLSFLLAVIIYPVVIGISWFQGFRDFGRGLYGEAVVRKFKYRVFDMLSENEIEVIRQFVTGKITRHHLQIRFSGKRLPQRSLAVALLVTIVLVIAPKNFGQNGNHYHPDKAQVEISSRSGPEIRSDVGQDNPDGSSGIVEMFFLEKEIRILLFIPSEILKRIIRVIRKIDHIPLNSYYLFLSEIKIFNNLIKGMHHEKFNFGLRIIF